MGHLVSFDVLLSAALSCFGNRDVERNRMCAAEMTLVLLLATGSYGREFVAYSGQDLAIIEPGVSGIR